MKKTVECVRVVQGGGYNAWFYYKDLQGDVWKGSATYNKPVVRAGDAMEILFDPKGKVSPDAADLNRHMPLPYFLLVGIAGLVWVNWLFF